MQIKYLLVVMIILLVGLPFASNAQYITLIIDLKIDTATLLRGYTVVSQDKNFNVGIRPEVLAEETRVIIKQFDRSLHDDYPEEWEPITDIYEFDIFNKASFKNEKPLQLRIETEATRHLKKMFFWNGVISEWVELPSQTFDEDTIRSIIHLPYAKMIVLQHKEILELGQASWYAYKNCDCAANPDYPKGTLLRVKNLNNDKTVIVKVNDYGPDRSIFPERVIDLDKVAFEKLGSLGTGVLKNILVTQIK
ncbi:MAG: septal ring lytic transglycosylase RlpA family protein [Candidatus Omnitrophota bacterium]